MTTAPVIHGHFHQPPRENLWTELVEREPGAHPFHDRNERIHAGRRRPNAYARIADAQGRVERVVNNYSRLGFNSRPTLLDRLERRRPETHARVYEETVTEAARLVVGRPDGENVRSARSLVEPGRELGPETNLKRGQGILYDAARAGAPLSDEVRELALRARARAAGCRVRAGGVEKPGAEAELVELGARVLVNS